MFASAASNRACNPGCAALISANFCLTSGVLGRMIAGHCLYTSSVAKIEAFSAPCWISKTVRASWTVLWNVRNVHAYWRLDVHSTVLKVDDCAFVAACSFQGTDWDFEQAVGGFCGRQRIMM